MVYSTSYAQSMSAATRANGQKQKQPQRKVLMRDLPKLERMDDLPQRSAARSCVAESSTVPVAVAVPVARNPNEVQHITHQQVQVPPSPASQPAVTIHERPWQTVSEVLNESRPYELEEEAAARRASADRARRAWVKQRAAQQRADQQQQEEQERKFAQVAQVKLEPTDRAPPSGPEYARQALERGRQAEVRAQKEYEECMQQGYLQQQVYYQGFLHPHAAAAVAASNRPSDLLQAVNALTAATNMMS